jgi:GT2 family glycosyltransferase
MKLRVAKIEKALVTVGLCARERVPEETLKSITDQEYEPYELITVLHGKPSPDRHVHITSVRGGCVQRRTFFEQQGLGRARQIVVENARGQYIAWVDDDNELPPDYLKSQAKFLEGHPDTAACQARVKSSRRAGMLGRVEAAVSKVYIDRISDRTDVPIGSAGGVYRVDALMNAGGFDAECKGASEDGDICIRLLKAGWKLRVNPAAFYYAFHDESLRRLWRRSFWYGKGDRWLNSKHGKVVSVFRHIPPVALVAAIRHLKALHKEIPLHLCLLHPFLYALKGLAWLWGYYS